MYISRLSFRRVSRLVALATFTFAIYTIALHLHIIPPRVVRKLSLLESSYVFLDLQVRQCSVLFSCKEPQPPWYMYPKSLNLGRKWSTWSNLYYHALPDAELAANAEVLVNVGLAGSPKVVPQQVIEDATKHNIALDPLDVASAQLKTKDIGWVLSDQKHGLWLKRGKYTPATAVTGVKVLFGSDAQYPLPGWTLLDGYFKVGQESTAPRLAIRQGNPSTPKPVLKANSKSKFKIVQVADLHFSLGGLNCHDLSEPLEPGETCFADKRALEFVGQVLDAEKPDLVIFTGDQIIGWNAGDPETVIVKAFSPAIARGIPFAVVFGNHDGDQAPMPNSEQMRLIEALPFSLASSGPAEVDGNSNYMLHVDVNGHAALTLYFLDTHAKIPGEGGRWVYDHVKESQLEYLRKLHQGIKGSQDKYSHVPLSMAFFHIPLPEYRNPVTRWFGEWREYVVAPIYNSGTLRTLTDLGVSVVSVGHDHCNAGCHYDESTGKPVWLCYGGAAGEGGYGGRPDAQGKNFERRLRVFEANFKSSSIQTWEWLRNGDSPLGGEVLFPFET